MIELSMESPGHVPRVRRFSSTMITVGRAADCELCVEDPAASRRHCRISRGLRGWLVEDLGSANGTRVAGERIVGTIEVLPGATIEIGDLRLRICGHARAEPAPRVQVRADVVLPVLEDRQRRAVPDRRVRGLDGARRAARLRSWLGVTAALGLAGLGGWASALAWDRPLVLVAPVVGACDAADPRLRRADALADAAAVEPEAAQAVRAALTALQQAQALGCGDRTRAGSALATALGRLDSQQLGQHATPLQALVLVHGRHDTKVAAIDGEGQVMLWDREGPGRTLDGVNGAQALARSEDGRWLVVGDAEGQLRWWELAGGEVLAAQTETSEPARATRVLAFDREGRTIHVDDDGHVQLWARVSAGSGEARWTRTTALLAWPGVTQVQVAGARLLVSGAGRAAVWQLDAAGVVHGKPLVLATGAAITAAALDEQGIQAVTGDAAGGVIRWRLGRRAGPEPLTAHAGAVHAVVWVGGAVGSVGADEALRVAELDRRVRREGPPLVLVADTPVPVDRLVVADAGRWLVGSGPTGAVVTWDLQQRSRRLPASLRPGHHGPVTALAAGDGWVVTGGEDGVVRAWDLVAAAPALAGDADLVARACRALGWREPGCEL